MARRRQNAVQRRATPAVIVLVAALAACSGFDIAPTPPASAGPDAGTPGEGGIGDTGSSAEGGSAEGGSSRYASTVLADGPVLYWRLSEGAGAFLDGSGNNRSGTLQGPAARGQPSLLASDPDLSLHVVKGSSVTGPVGVLDFSNRAPYSLECWLRVDEAPTGDVDVLTMSENGGDGTGLFFNSIGDLLMARANQNHGGHVFTFGPTPHHIVATYDGTAMRLFVDGVSQDHTNTSTLLLDTKVGMWIGKVGNNAPSLDGWIDEVAVYPVALTENRIAAHYAAGRGP